MINIKVIFEKIINYAIKIEGSDIHIDLEDEANCLIKVRRFGSMENISELGNKHGHKLINYILFKAKFDVVNKQALQTKTIKYLFEDYEYFLRVSLVFTSKQKSIVIRITNNHKLINIKQLTPIKESQLKLEDILNMKNGLVIFTGKTGSGKTTSLYALVSELIKDTKLKVITLEDPIERVISGAFQVNVNKDIYSYFDVLKQVLRHDPDIIIIGELRDALDLKLTIQAALSGHLVLTTMHAINALFAINRLLELDINLSDLKACLKLIAYQELFYTKNYDSFSLYEFIDHQQINEYLNNKDINYLDINYYKQSLAKELKFYETK